MLLIDGKVKILKIRNEWEQLDIINIESTLKQ